MLRELLAASFLLLVLSSAVAAASPVAPSAVAWRAEMLGSGNVSLGSPISFVVYGPPSGGFNVSLAGAPPLSSVVFFAHSFTLPNSTTNATLGASEVVSIPTTGLAYGPYSLVVANTSGIAGGGGFEFAAFSPHLVPGVNATVLVGQILYLESLYNATRLSEMQQADQIAHLDNLVTGLEYTLVGVAVGCVLAVAWYTTGDSWGAIGDKIRWGLAALQNLVRSAPNSNSCNMRGPNLVSPPDPEAVWYVRAFRLCPACPIPDVREAKIRHLMTGHPGHPMKREAAERLVERSIPEEKRIASVTRTPLLTRKAYRKAMKHARIDWSE